MKLHLQVVNINGLKFTKALVSDLLRQTHQFQLTLIDQGSTEFGTSEYLQSLQEIPYIDIEIIKNDSNIDLNRLWNRLYEKSNADYLCFLNNDVRISKNFVEDTIAIFEKEKRVGAVVHATNHSDYQVTSQLRYVILDEKITQGWDFTIRKEAYELIPDELKVFGGDDWLFVKMYRKYWKTAVALSSPIIHYKRKSHKFYAGDRNEESKALRNLGIERLFYGSKYSKTFPTFVEIVEGDNYY